MAWIRKSDKEVKYQVYLSSTYADLTVERQQVIRTLLENNFIPVAMEFFPPISQKHMKIVKSVIDNCDYYVLLVGGKYGSIIPGENISYTEKEYKYAVRHGKKVLAFFHANPDELPKTKSEVNLHSKKKLLSFRKNVQKNHLVLYWKSIKELPLLVNASLIQAVNLYPQKPRLGSVFISYAREDFETAQEIHDFLRKSGYIPWMDRIDLKAGQEWELEIQKNIENSDFFLACLSKKSVNKRGYIQNELRKATRVLESVPEGQFYLIPIRLDECIVPMSLKSKQWLNLFEPNAKDKLLEALKANRK